MRRAGLLCRRILGGRLSATLPRCARDCLACAGFLSIGKIGGFVRDPASRERIAQLLGSRVNKAQRGVRHGIDRIRGARRRLGDFVHVF